ncbi:MAG: SDR family NAD(P)-dependent oxidoreductase [Bacteroidota bacterium]
METVSSKIYVVTSVTSPLGKAIALGLAITGATVIMVAPADSNGEEVEREISTITQNPHVELRLADLSNLSSVRNLAEIINSRYEKIDVLINNNSIYRKQRHLTVDGFEEMFAANYLGPFLLTNLLLDRLRASGQAHILNLTAPTTGQLDFDDLQNERRFNSIQTFQAARAASLLFTYELARRLENSGVSVSAFYPGLVRSEILKEAPWINRMLAWLFALTPGRAAKDVTKYILSPELKDSHGKFMRKDAEIQLSDYFQDRGLQQRLWEISEELTDARYLAPNYDPTGSMALYNERDIPEGLIRPVEDPTVEKNGVVKREQKTESG